MNRLMGCATLLYYNGVDSNAYSLYNVVAYQGITYLLLSFLSFPSFAVERCSVVLEKCRVVVICRGGYMTHFDDSDCNTDS